MDAEHPTSPRHLLGRVAATLLALLLLYPLSYGPAVYLEVKWGYDFRAVERFYAPLVWATDDTPLATPMQTYICWWTKRTGAVPTP